MRRSRLATGFHRVGLILAVPTAVCGAAGLVAALFPVPDPKTLATISLCVIAFAGVLYAVSWGLGWVLRGFIEGDRPPPQPASLGAAAAPAIAAKPVANKRDLEGIAGWMILPALATLVAPIRLSITAVELGDIVSRAEGSEHIVFKIAWVELGANILLAGLWSWAVILLWNKRLIYPSVFICLLVAGLALSIIDGLALIYVLDAALDGETRKNILQSVFACAIWIPYMLMSKRVRNTFVK